MNHTPPRRRLWLFLVALVAAFGAAGFRLVDLQVVRHEELQARARANTQRSFYRQAPRGEIRDIRGNPLATSKLVKTVCADPTLICNTNIGNRQEAVATLLAPLLATPREELLRQLQLRTITNKTGQPVLDRYVVLKRKIKVEEWEKIRQSVTNENFGIDEKRLTKSARAYYKLLRAKAIFAEDDQLREYPNKMLAAHVLGFVGEEGRGTNQASYMEMVGREGAEFSLNKVLTGARGWVTTEIDRGNNEMALWRVQEVEPNPGLNAVLTLDLGLQNIVETELAQAVEKHHPVSASAIVVRPRTGEIVAMATWPTFDPNQAGKYPPELRRNRTICDISEPGSTFKIVVVAGALNERTVGLNDVFDCENGRFVYAGKALHDHERYGRLTVEQIITKSSNIGAAKIGIRLGPEKLYEYVRAFGFGSHTGIPLPGEVRGEAHPVNEWTKLSISRIPMGHEVSATPLQMVMAMSALANGGRLMKPMLLDRFEDDKGRVVMRFQPQTLRRVCSETAARQMVAALKTVVATNGTAPKAQLENYVVAGKTGTAKKNDGRVYLDGKYFASFIGFFPADRPELCVSVVLDEPHQGYYGGQTAAPIFKNIAERSAHYLSLPPDMLANDTSTSGQPGAARTQTARARRAEETAP